MVNEKQAVELVESLIALSHAVRSLKRGQSSSRASTILLGVISLGTVTRVSDIADYLHLSPSTVSRQVDELVSEGLIKRSADQSDGRSCTLLLTAQGKATLGEARKAFARTMVPALDDWSEDDFNTFISLTNRLQTSLNKAERAKGNN